MRGPTTAVAEQIQQDKHRLRDETFEEAMDRIKGFMADTLDHHHSRALEDVLKDQRFLPAGRIQNAAGSERNVTAFNCFVSGPIEDSMESIMKRAAEAAETMRMGGGIGYDFSEIRPRGSDIVSLGSSASGPVSFMGIFDAVCGTISSAGHRRGAQMGILRVDHPDIREFVRAKQNSENLRNFNVSVGITDEFMWAVDQGKEFDLRFKGQVVRTVDARELFDEIMWSTWDWAEPGVVFLDTINDSNPLGAYERINATNPCSEQPLPPFGACLLGSFNLPKYLEAGPYGAFTFNFMRLEEDVLEVVRGMDNVIDRTLYPLPEQETEARLKRRMGLGVTGAANAIELLGSPYGSLRFCATLELILNSIRTTAYYASSELATTKGPAPIFDFSGVRDNYRLNFDDSFLEQRVRERGLRNTHLTSIAPTGTISLAADNVSSGIQPVFAYEQTRQVRGFNETEDVVLQDWAVREHGFRGKKASECTVDDYLDVLEVASKCVDSAVSNTVNVGSDVSFDEFKGVYEDAWDRGIKGVATFRLNGKRFGVLQDAEIDQEGAACSIDPDTGIRSCDN